MSKKISIVINKYVIRIQFIKKQIHILCKIQYRTSNLDNIFECKQTFLTNKW